MSVEVLPRVEIEPRGPATHSVIWLHGLGADGHDFEPIVPYLGIDPELGLRFVFPHAPRIPVTINMGLIMPAWYDVRDIDLRRDHDEAGVRRAAGQVRALVSRENERGIPCERIILAGFSQGGAVAMYVALRHPDKLLGLMALSTYLVGEDTLEAERGVANASIPVFQAHGSFDPMVPIERGLATCERLQSLGYPVEWHTYRAQHEVHPEEIRDIGAWLGARLKNS